MIAREMAVVTGTVDPDLCWVGRSILTDAERPDVAGMEFVGHAARCSICALDLLAARDLLLKLSLDRQFGRKEW